MATTLSRRLASALLRLKVARDDANDFERTEASEGTVLRIKTSSNVVLDEARILALDSAERRYQRRTDAADLTGLIPFGYVIPDNTITRTVTEETLSAGFLGRNRLAVGSFIEKAYSLFPEFIPSGATIAPLSPLPSLADLAMPVKSLDFSLDLIEIFGQLDNSKIFTVDAPNDPYVTVNIVGGCTDGIVIACGLMIQT